MLDCFRARIKDCVFLNPLTNYLNDMISFRDCLGHQANLVHASKLRMTVVLDVIKRMEAIQTMARTLFLNDPTTPLKGCFALLPELVSALEPQPGRGKHSLSDYATFRQRQLLTQKKKLRARLRSNAKEIIKYLIELPDDDDAFRIAHCQAMLVDPPTQPQPARSQKREAADFTHKTWFSSLESLGEEVSAVEADTEAEAEAKDNEGEQGRKQSKSKASKQAGGGRTANGGGRRRGGRRDGKGKGGK